MAKRSPILGYNHNVRHRGLLFHVQTEDSGVDNPHIFTHLFHSGVIISTRKLQYDRGSAEEVVKALMQAQHKASLRELKAGTFDEKISAYLGEHPDLEPSARARTQRDTLDSPPPELELPGRSYGMGPTSAPHGPLPGPPPPPPLSRLSEHGAIAEPSRTGRSGDVSNAFRMIKREGTAPEELTPPPLDLRPPPIAPPVPRRRASSQTGYAHHRTGQLERMPDVHEPPPGPPARKSRAPAVVSPVPARPPAGASPMPMGRTTTPGIAPVRPAGKQRPPSSPSIPVPAPGGQAPRAGVVVSRPAVIVGAAPRVVSPRDAGAGPVVPRTVRRAREDSRQSLFGKDLISERSLDEVILAYLSEDSQDK